MRELAIGDIHGCVRALETVLELVRPEATDTLVFLGDYVDRGPDSCGVLEAIMKWNERCTVVALSGNHEKMMLQSRTDPKACAEWLKQGGHATLDSYGRHGFGRDLAAVPEAHWKFLTERTLNYWESSGHIFVHASLDPDLDLADQPDFLLFWQRFTNPTVHKSGKRIVCGHTGQASGFPAIFDKGICIDTVAYAGGWLTCFDTTSQTFIQANERGQQRTFDFGRLTGR